MEVIPDPAAAARLCAALRSEGRLGFVPTMGALHGGHLQLVRRSRAECDRTVVSIFVNPLQFNDRRDLETYPRDLPGDLERLRHLGVDLVFTPAAAAMYPPGHTTRVRVEGLTAGLCGRYRPGHFEGVTTVVTQLFAIVRPHRAYFGAKDYQQALVVRRLARDLHLGVQIVIVPTVRDRDGLALSSRNARLSPAGREAARALYRALCRARDAYRAGERDARRLAEAARAVLEAAGGVEPQYVEVVDAETLEPLTRIEGRALLALAAYVEGVRLIDNCLLGEEP